jgi:CheY-like chemotaxis protein
MSSIVHDIRTPANGLLGFLEILQEQIDDSRLKEYVGHAKKSALLINELTTSILDGVSEGRETLNKEPQRVNTVKFFSDIAEIFSANMFKKNINYNIFIDPLLPKEIQLDSMKIKRVIMNLISNASKFTPENGSIEFSLRYKAKEKKLHIFVKDSGIGIAKEKQKDVFKAFTQAEDDTKEKYGGTGLGLSICAEYVKEMGGKLSLESKLNHGCIFYFDLAMDIKDYAKQFEAIENKESTVVAILMDTHNTVVANHIARYLVKIGVNVDQVTAITQLKQLESNVTHLISFENKLSGDLFIEIKRSNIKLLAVEENFLSLNLNNIDGAMLISQYTYFGNTLYTFINENTIPKVLIVEDDNISIILIKAMLENEYCEIDIAENGQDGLELLSFALKSGKPYNIVYTDHNMPILSGTDMIKQYKVLEAKTSLQNTFTVSISGDEKKIGKDDYDYFATKPFKKQEIVSQFLQTLH